MERRKQPYTISKPQPLQRPIDAYASVATTPQNSIPPNALSAPSAQPTVNNSRPLSDIRELSEPSVIDAIAQRVDTTNERDRSARRPVPLKLDELSKENIYARTDPCTHGAVQHRPLAKAESSSSYSSTPARSGFYTIPYSSVPCRSSSQNHTQRRAQENARNPSIRSAAPPPQPKFDRFTVPNHGRSHSPVKQAAARSDPVKSDAGRRVPSRTYIRTTPSADILEFPSYRHPRVKLELRVSSPLFVGGGSIEGFVHVTVDEQDKLRARRSLAMGGLAVDLLGFEDMPNGRRAPFLAIGTEVIDTCHPPPANMVEPPNPLAAGDSFWTLTPSVSALPFMISLPLDTGPPPFQSRIANIRFLLCATALISDAGKHYRIRTSQDVSVIATYNPEKALTSLTNPLTASEELSQPRFGRLETLKLTAGLHRQVWISGSSIFVDVHIVNKTHKPVKCLELNLERDILCYKHPPAETAGQSASQARVFESNEQRMIARSILKPGQLAWNGVPAHSSETRTCELELPRGHATVRCGKYFEVRFFLNVTASLANTKLVTVQLPIILIHMNSLDVLPNSVAQVAAAMEEKRSLSRRTGPSHSSSRRQSSSSPTEWPDVRRKPSYSQGRAFAAPRQQSARRLRAAKSDVEDLGQALDLSPRKFPPIGDGRRAARLGDWNISQHDFKSCLKDDFGSEMQGTVVRKVGSDITVGAVSLGGKKNYSDLGSGLMRKPYKTPPGSQYSTDNHRRHAFVKMAGLNALPRMHSLDSVWSEKSSSNRRRDGIALDQNVKPQYHFSLPPKRTGRPGFGLANATDQKYSLDPGAPDDPYRSPRPGTALSFRDKLNQKKFGWKDAIKRKTSGALAERRRDWLEPVVWRHDPVAERWI